MSRLSSASTIDPAESSILLIAIVIFKIRAKTIIMAIEPSKCKLVKVRK
jgi:hypothetical protein